MCYFGPSCLEGGFNPNSGSGGLLLTSSLPLLVYTLSLFSGSQSVQASACLLGMYHVLWTVRDVKINNHYHKN